MNIPQAARRAGVTTRQLDHWCRRGWISPRTQQPIGHGIVREFTRDEVTRIKHLAALVNAGMRPELAAAALDRAVDDNGRAVIITGKVTIVVEAA